jgi:ribosomal protein L32
MGGFTNTKIIANRMAAYHQKELKKFCRECGERISRNRVSFSCQQHADNIAHTFGVFCRDDCPDLHPPYICHGCFSVTLRSKAAVEKGNQYHHSVKTFSWISHSPDEFTICEHFEKISTGGRPRKMRRNPGRPATISTRSAIDHIHSIAPPSFFPVNDTPAREVTQLDSDSANTAELVLL